MKETANYALRMIELDDSPPDITVINENWEKIDQKLKDAEDHIKNTLAHVTEEDRKHWDEMASGMGEHDHDDKYAPLSHVADDSVHVTEEDRTKWDNAAEAIENGQNYDDRYAPLSHVSDESAHVTDTDRESWNNKISEIEIGETITGEPGTNASVVNTGTPSHPVLVFTIPAGVRGDPGESSIPGDLTEEQLNYILSGLLEEIKNHNEDLSAHAIKRRAIRSRQRDPNKPDYYNIGVFLDTENYSGTAEISVIVSGQEYDAKNLSKDEETASSGTLIFKILEE